MGLIQKVQAIRSSWLMYIRKKRFGDDWSSKITNHDVSIISSNCLGGVISHDLGLRFNSPTINMWMPANDYIVLLKDLKANIEGKLEDISGDSDYPIGLLNGIIHIHFIHYHSFAEVKQKWDSRVRRINYNNLRIIMVENDGCSYKELLEFEKLNFNKKVVFTHKPYPEISSSFYIPGFERLGRVAFVMGWKGLLGRRNCDVFDWISFINE